MKTMRIIALLFIAVLLNVAGCASPVITQPSAQTPSQQRNIQTENIPIQTNIETPQPNSPTSSQYTTIQSVTVSTKTITVPIQTSTISTKTTTVTTKADIVYITKTGEKYHRAGCRYLSNSPIPIERAEAIRKGYTPCSVCSP